jgi:hypothetical protein
MNYKPSCLMLWCINHDVPAFWMYSFYTCASDWHAVDVLFSSIFRMFLWRHTCTFYRLNWPMLQVLIFMTSTQWQVDFWPETILYLRLRPIRPCLIVCQLWISSITDIEMKCVKQCNTSYEESPVWFSWADWEIMSYLTFMYTFTVFYMFMQAL